MASKRSGVVYSSESLDGRLPFAPHGARELPGVIVENYNAELRESGRFVGDRANKESFLRRLDERRKAARRHGGDPFGDRATADIRKKALDAILRNGDPASVVILTAAVDDFARDLATVIRRFVAKKWKKVEAIAIGGGFRKSRVGELAIVKAQTLLHEMDLPIRLVPIHHAPNDAGLIGAAYLAPPWIFEGFDALLAIDIGGTNVRCGLVHWKRSKFGRMGRPLVAKSLLWRHRDDRPRREEVTAELIAMLNKLVRAARKEKFTLAPYVGVGCPGQIRPDGTIARGAQNLPGNWQAEPFHLPTKLRAGLPRISNYEPVVMMHNDAVVQGLSELPWMRTLGSWGVLTIGTGLGNAKFISR